MADQLEDMMAAQHDLQVESFGLDPMDLSPEERATFLLWNAFALTDEIHEAMQEVGWKPWATDRSIDREAFRKELVDADHFLMNMWLSSYPPGTDIAVIASERHRLYFEKRQENARRQAEGYTGTDKCPDCHRDKATTMRSVTVDDQWVNGNDISTVELVVEYCPCGYQYR